MSSALSIPEPTVLAAFISNVLVGWLLVGIVVGAVAAVVVVGAWALARGTRPAPRHNRGIGRQVFAVPPHAQRRPAQHCGQSAAAETTLLPAIAPVYLGPPIETAQPMPTVQQQRPVVTAGGAR